MIFFNDLLVCIGYYVTDVTVQECRTKQAYMTSVPEKKSCPMSYIKCKK